MTDDDLRRLERDVARDRQERTSREGEGPDIDSAAGSEGSSESTESGGTPSSTSSDPPVSAETNPFQAAARETGGVATQWWTGMEQSVQELVSPKPPAKPQTAGQEAAAVVRRVQTVVSNAFAVLGVPEDMLNVGFANLTAPLAAVAPSMPAATMTMMYMGAPHAHNHPPSLVPPAPPAPLPSLGPITLGTCVRVLINGMPAARCGDIGVAMTCGGLFPFFQIKTGSSNTFIGGNRAARMLDVCEACTMADEREDQDAGELMGKIGAAARAAQKGIEIGGHVVGAAAIAADAAEAAAEDDAAMQSAKALSAAMGAAQMAADLAAQAMTKMMGKDPGIPPGTKGALLLGHPNVLIGGFPMVNIPNPVDLLLDKLSRYRRKPPEENKKPGECGSEACG